MDYSGYWIRNLQERGNSLGEKRKGPSDGTKRKSGYFLHGSGNCDYLLNGRTKPLFVVGPVDNRSNANVRRYPAPLSQIEFHNFCKYKKK